VGHRSEILSEEVSFNRDREKYDQKLKETSFKERRRKVQDDSEFRAKAFGHAVHE